MQEFMRKRRCVEIAAICLFVMTLSSCAGLWPSRIGGIIPDRDAGLIFTKMQCSAEFQYYYSGSEHYPSAIIGIRKDSKLEDDTLWKAVDMSPKLCRDMVSNVETRALQLNLFPYGFSILDDQGKRIGVWYSIITAPTSVWMKDDHTAVIYTPDIDTYIRYERDSG